jgi:cell volume regulation protein A
VTVPLLFALLGTVILVGFLANLLFKLTKIPSVLVLIAIGVVLGPATGWIQHDALLTIAPFFGAVALLVILFEGGLELDIAHVVRHAPRTALFTATVFALSMGAVAGVAYLALGLPASLSLMLGAVLGATSPAICMPVVSVLSIREDVKTVIKLESAMGEVLLIVSVVLLIQGHEVGHTGATSWIWGFARSLLVALVVATIAGVLWSRLVGWLGREPLSYMLTLGVTCLLYFVVEEFGGSPAIAVLLFGLLLANMQFIAGRVGPRLRELFGIHVKDDQFVLGEFMVNITAELSFLVRTFFFVYLGLLLDFSALSASRAASIAVMFGLLLVSRGVGMSIFRRSGASFSAGEWQAIMALQPRGLATAVVAFMPLQAGIDEAAQFPLFAFAVIVLSNLFMTGGILFAERRLRLDAERGEADAALSTAPPTESARDATTDEEPAAASPAAPRRHPLFSPARDFEDEPTPTNLTDWMARVSGVRLADREAAYADLLRASFLSEPLFWVQSLLGASICALGLILGQTTVVIGGALIVPAARPVLTTGLALATGDLYLLVKLAVKLVGFSVVTVIVSTSLVSLVPLADVLNDLVIRTRPTILDFLVSLFGGMSAAAIVARRRGPAIQYLPGAVVGLTLVPALCVVGFALTDAVSAGVLRQATLQFIANMVAAILGAALVLLTLGVHRAAQSPLIRQWKAEELSTPLASAMFRRLGVEEAIGGTGSVRARVVVIALFLLLLLTPLQLAFNQVRSELRARQAVARALNTFNVPNRSAIIGSTIALTDDRVDVRLQVATSALFSAEERARFEQRIYQETGRRARVDLVQTVADVGDAGTLRQLLELDQSRRLEPLPTVRSSLQEAEGLLSRVLRDATLPGGARIVSVRTSLGNVRGPGLELVYLSDRDLDPDAQALLAQLLSVQTQIPLDRITLAWLPATHALRIARGALDAEAAAALGDVRMRVLPQLAELAVTVTVTQNLSRAEADAVARRIQEDLGLSEMPAVVTDPAMDRRTAVLRIAVQAEPS